MRTTTRRATGATASAIAVTMVGAMAVLAIPQTAVALSGTADYQPAESDISGKYWVSATATDGDAALALDGDPETAWVAAAAPASLTVDLGGAYDAVHKVETTFSSNRTAYAYVLEGTADGTHWVTLADRSGNTRPGGIFTDVFSLEGLTKLRITVTAGQPVGIRELRVINYLRPDLNNGSDSSEQGGNTNAYYFNAGNSPAVEGVRGGRFSDPDSIATGNNYFGLTKDLGWDTTRLRVWNEPKNETNGTPNTSAGNNSPENTRRVAKAVVGAGQDLAIDLHYADSWADPQNQSKPYAWAGLSFDQLQDATYQYTYDFVKSLVDQGTAPTVVALGNEITNGMMWGSEYDSITPYVHHHDYYTSGRFSQAPGGGVEWIKYEEANGDTNSPAYQEFLASVERLAKLIDAGNRAIDRINSESGLDIDTQLHFAFNVFEQPATGGKVALDPDQVLAKVRTLISTLSTSLDAKSGMVDRIGLSYYPDWHGTYDVVQRNLVELSGSLPGVLFTIAECSPKSSGTVTDPMSDPNHPVGFQYSVQSQGDDSADIMKVINDVPNNVGTGVWPWAGTNVFATGSGANGTLRASFKVWNDAFAKNVVESQVYTATRAGLAPLLPRTVTSLDLASGEKSRASVVWDAVDPAAYAAPGTFTVHGTAQVTVPTAGRGKAMTDVTVTVDVLDADDTSQDLQVVIPEGGVGEFVWAIDGSNGLVDLGTAALDGDHYAATGSINPVRVTDTRAAGPTWSVSASVSDFVSGEDAFDGKYLGWTPKVTENEGGAVAGEHVATGFASGGPGLSESATLGSAPGAHPRGSALLGADLALDVPVSVGDGTYRATLVLTALS